MKYQVQEFADFEKFWLMVAKKDLQTILPDSYCMCWSKGIIFQALHTQEFEKVIYLEATLKAIMRYLIA